MNEKMICIKSIDLVEVDRDHMEMVHYTPTPWHLVPVDSMAVQLEEKVVTEFIKGREFVMPDGKRIMIGYSKQVEEALGLPMDVFENMNRRMLSIDIENQNLKADRRYYKGTLDGISEWKVWKRLKFLFSGSVRQL